MGCAVMYKEKAIFLSNRHFNNVLEFCLAVGEAGPFDADDEREFHRIKTEFDASMFWNGRGITIEEDMPHVAQQKLWARLFADAARAVFLREVGNQNNSCWQARCIAQMMTVSDLFVAAVRDTERGWYPETRDVLETRMLPRVSST